jgi:hypothetical protein
MQESAQPLSEALVGTWELVSRQGRTSSGRAVPSPFGEDPIALLIYDGHGSFSAQFMKRDRETETVEAATGSPSALNNTRPIGGYDAYFGRYVVDDESQLVTQTLVGSLSRENVGQVVTRQLSVAGDELTIRVDTETADGEPAVITLRWRRLSAGLAR